MTSDDSGSLPALIAAADEHHRAGRFAEAQSLYVKAISLKPDLAAAHGSLGAVLQETGQLAAAIDCYRRALALRPDLLATRFNLVQALSTIGDPDSAIAEGREVLRRDPRHVDTWFFLGGVLQSQGRRTEAQECFRQVIALRPDFVPARWSLAMSELPVAYGPGENPADAREAFATALTELEQWLDHARPSGAFQGVGSMQPYYLAYHEQNNRDLLSRYGDLCADLMRTWFAEQGLDPPTKRNDGRIRVGIVSGRIYDQSVWTAIVKGWCQRIEQDRLELHLLSTGAVADRETELARRLVPRFVEGLKSLRQWVGEILARRFDVLIYPEIGMDRMCIRLASLRLAPAQVAAWGHPETTGLPTIDYYLSAEAFEPPGAQSYYREELVPLPGIGCVYEPLDVAAPPEPENAAAFDSASALLLCPGTPYKYDPRHDDVLVEIARRVPDCRLIFFDDIYPSVSGLLRARLESVFADAGLRFGDHGAFVPHQSRASFYALMQRADLCLDTVGFSGFNTAMQAIECGLPIVAYEGKFMRGRFASGILRRAGLTELVATSKSEYVDRVVGLAGDVARLQKARARVAEASRALYADAAPVAALEAFLIKAAGRT
jgi:predicted O-linked N-acetylglucosamine transferase (SPINDLY family)